MSKKTREGSLLCSFGDVSKKLSVFIFTICIMVLLALERTAYLKPYTVVEELSPLRNQLDSMNKKVNSDKHQKHATIEEHTKTTLDIQATLADDMVVNSVPTASEFITESNPVAEVLSRKKIVLIVAYMRTGSTLTASILQEYPGTFYAFEPIRSTTRNFKSKNVTLKYLNGTKRVYDISMRHDTVMKEIKSWLTCQLADIHVDSFIDIPNSKYIDEFKACYTLTQNQSRSAINLCLNKIISRCRNSPLIVLKFIKLRMPDAVDLLPYFPNMKILHLVRDPRGILNSRANLKTANASKNVPVVCNSIKNDLNVTKSMQKTLPGRIKLIFYEDLAENPIHISRAMSDFGGINFTDNMKSYIMSQTSSTKSSCSYCTARKNSTKTASKWRTQLNPKYARFIYNTCEESNNFLGFLPFHTDIDQRNLSLRSRTRLDPVTYSNLLISVSH